MSEPKKSYYAIIPASVRYDKEIRPNAKLLYGEITALCNEKGFCWASNQYFANLYSVSKTSISLWIKELTDNGYLTIELVYKEGSKEILHRYLRLVNDPIQQKLNTPPQEKLKDNNTSFNTTSNNTSNKDIVGKPDDVPYKDVVDYLNEKTGSRFRSTSKATQRLIKARFNEKYTLDDFKKVIDVKTSEWLNDKEMSKFLRPETLFSPKFESYLNQKQKARSSNYDTSEYDDLY